MRRNSVSSSMIASVGYDFKAKVLEVEFSWGIVYQYDGVPHSKYLGLMSAKSHGRYFHEFIKDQYSFRKLQEAQK